MATLIVKCIERCNATCLYCDVERSHPRCHDMTPEILELLFQRIDEYLDAHPEEAVQFTWHGGEPLLLGEGYLSLARDLMEQECPSTKGRIHHCMQSNLTILNERHIKALKSLGIFHLGSSYDPQPGVRGLGPHIDTETYNRAFLRGTSLLERHGMSWGIIYVVTQRSLEDPMAVFRTLTNLLSNRGLMMNPVVVSHESVRDLAITPEEYADFLGAIFPYWYEHRARYSTVEPFATYWTNLAEGNRKLFCSESGNCATTHLNIDPSGAVSKCGRSSDLHIMQWGNIRTSTLDELFDRSKHTFAGRTEALADGDCRDCKLFSICHGGCPIDSFVAHGNYGHKTDWCEAKQRFVAQYFEPLTGINVMN